MPKGRKLQFIRKSVRLTDLQTTRKTNTIAIEQGLCIYIYIPMQWLDVMLMLYQHILQTYYEATCHPWPLCRLCFVKVISWKIEHLQICCSWVMSTFVCLQQTPRVINVLMNTLRYELATILQIQFLFGCRSKTGLRTLCVFFSWYHHHTILSSIWIRIEWIHSCMYADVHVQFRFRFSWMTVCVHNP